MDYFNGKLLLLPLTLQTFSIRVTSETEIKQKVFSAWNINWISINETLQTNSEMPFVYYGRVRSTSLPNVRDLTGVQHLLLLWGFFLLAIEQNHNSQRGSKCKLSSQLQLVFSFTNWKYILWLCNIYACSLCFVLQCLVAWVRFSWEALSSVL